MLLCLRIECLEASGDRPVGETVLQSGLPLSSAAFPSLSSQMLVSHGSQPSSLARRLSFQGSPFPLCFLKVGTTKLLSGFFPSFISK